MYQNDDTYSNCKCSFWVSSVVFLDEVLRYNISLLDLKITKRSNTEGPIHVCYTIILENSYCKNALYLPTDIVYESVCGIV